MAQINQRVALVFGKIIQARDRNPAGHVGVPKRLSGMGIKGTSCVRPTVDVVKGPSVGSSGQGEGHGKQGGNFGIQIHGLGRREIQKASFFLNPMG